MVSSVLGRQQSACRQTAWPLKISVGIDFKHALVLLFCFYFKLTLLRFNLHTTKCTQLKRSLMHFHKRVHLCNHSHSQDIKLFYHLKKFPYAPLQSIAPTLFWENHQFRLVLSIKEFHKIESFSVYSFYVWFIWLIMSVRFIRVVAFTNILFLFIAE